MSRRQLVLAGLLVLIGVATLAGIATALMPSRFLNFDLVATAMVVGLYGLGGLVLVSIAGTQRLLFRVCAVALALSMAAFLIEIWGLDLIGWPTMQVINKAGAVSLFLGLLLAHRMLIAPMRVRGALAHIAKRTALISAAVLFALSTAGMITGGYGMYEAIGLRVLLVSGILAAGSTIATGATALLMPKPGEDEPGLLEGSIAVELACPRCLHAITARSNRESRCEHCRLKVRVEIEEPRCACGYLLYQLQSDLCPECGRTVEEGERWSGPSIQNA